jgi:hypothetical protein
VDVGVDIERRLPRADDVGRLPVSVEDQHGRIRVAAEQTEGGRDPGLVADVEVQVPARLETRVRLFEGKIILKGLTGTVNGASQRGSIEGSALAGAIRLETGIGDIILRDTHVTPGGVIRLRAFNGTVDLSLRERPPDARILALSLSGRITSDLPLATRTTFGPRFGEATLGKGEPVISIDVVNGDIRIRTGRGP